MSNTVPCVVISELHVKEPERELLQQKKFDCPAHGSWAIARFCRNNRFFCRCGFRFLLFLFSSTSEMDRQTLWIGLYVLCLLLEFHVGPWRSTDSASAFLTLFRVWNEPKALRQSYASSDFSSEPEESPRFGRSPRFRCFRESQVERYFSTILADLDLTVAERIAEQLKIAVEAHCDRIEVVGSIRRRKTKRTT